MLSQDFVESTKKEAWRPDYSGTGESYNPITRFQSVDVGSQ